jgi:hypothetical protein
MLFNDIKNIGSQKNDVDDIDPYNDSNKGRGAFVGTKEEGFDIRKYMSLKLSKHAYPIYPQYTDSRLYDQAVEGQDSYTTPLFDIFNTYFTYDGEYNGKEIDFYFGNFIN